MAQQSLQEQQHQQQPHGPQPMLVHAHPQQPPGSPGPVAMHPGAGGYYMPVHPMHMQYGGHPMYAQPPPYVVPYGYAQQPARPPPGVMFAVTRMGSDAAAGQLPAMVYGQQPGMRPVQPLARQYGPPPDSPVGAAAAFRRFSRPPSAGGGWVLGSPLHSNEMWSFSSSAGYVQQMQQRDGSPSHSGGSGDAASSPDRVGPLPVSQVMVAAAPQQPGAPVLIPLAPHRSRSAPAHDSVRVASDGGSTARIGSSLPSLISSESPSLASFSEDFAERVGPHPWTAAAPPRMTPPAEPMRPTCAFYLKTGTCAYGDKCKFLHPSDRIPHVQLNSLGLPVRPGETECAYYMKNMRCGFGPSCKFHHPELAVGWVPAGAAPMGPSGMIPMMPGAHGMMPGGPVPHGLMPPGMMPHPQPMTGPMVYPGHLPPMGVNMRMSMLQPNGPMAFPESVGGSTGGFADGEAGIGRRVASSVNLGSRAGSVDLEVTSQMGPPTLARSRSNVGRARTRRPARAAHSLAHSDANHVADGVHPVASGAPFALSQSGLLASPFAAAAAATSDISHASTDEPVADDAAAAVESSAVDQGPGEGDVAADAEPAAATGGLHSAAGVMPGVQTSTSTRQEQDYAIVEAPESLHIARRPSSALLPQEYQPRQDAQIQAAGAAVAEGVDGTQQPEYLAELAPLLHAGLHAVPPSIPFVTTQPGGSAQSQSAAETVASPISAGGAADVAAGLERLRVSGARSGVGGTETAGSTPVSFSSAAST